MVIVATAIIFKMYASSQESIASMEVMLENHFALVKAGNFQQAYDNFHRDLQQRISAEEYETGWMERIEKYGPMRSWKIHTANKSSNLFTSDEEYDVVLFIGFGADKEDFVRVYHIWKIEEGEIRLKYSGLHNSASNSSTFDVF